METRQAEPLKAAVIGTGKISEEHLRFLGRSPHACLVAVCDLSAAMARFMNGRAVYAPSATTHTSFPACFSTAAAWTTRSAACSSLV